MDISGRFTIAEITKNTFAVGLVGSATIEGLTKDNIAHILSFYGVSCSSFQLLKEYPAKLNLTHYNGFILINMV